MDLTSDGYSYCCGYILAHFTQIIGLYWTCRRGNLWIWLSDCLTFTTVTSWLVSWVTCQWELGSVLVVKLLLHGEKWSTAQYDIHLHPVSFYQEWASHQQLTLVILNYYLSVGKNVLSLVASAFVYTFLHLCFSKKLKYWGFDLASPPPAFALKQQTLCDPPCLPLFLRPSSRLSFLSSSAQRSLCHQLVMSPAADLSISN